MKPDLLTLYEQKMRERWITSILLSCLILFLNYILCTGIVL